MRSQKVSDSTNYRPKIIPVPQASRGNSTLGDLAKYCSAPNIKYSGRSCYQKSLARHQSLFYAQARLCKLSTDEGLKCFILMIEPHSLAGSFFFKVFIGHVRTLEKAFKTLFQWDKINSNYGNILRREWKNLKISSFRTDTQYMVQSYRTFV